MARITLALAALTLVCGCVTEADGYEITPGIPAPTCAGANSERNPACPGWARPEPIPDPRPK